MALTYKEGTKFIQGGRCREGNAFSFLHLKNLRTHSLNVEGHEYSPSKKCPVFSVYPQNTVDYKTCQSPFVLDFYNLTHLPSRTVNPACKSLSSQNVGCLDAKHQNTLSMLAAPAYFSEKQHLFYSKRQRTQSEEEKFCALPSKQKINPV